MQVIPVTKRNVFGSYGRSTTVRKSESFQKRSRIISQNYFFSFEKYSFLVVQRNHQLG